MGSSTIHEAPKPGPTMQLWMDVYVAAIRAGACPREANTTADRAYTAWRVKFGAAWDKAMTEHQERCQT